jgi:hypothetical protein
VLSPAAGTVVAVVDGIADSETLGEQSLPAGAGMVWAAGNHMVIEHDRGVHSCLAHRGSIACPSGRRWRRGPPSGP